MTHPTDPAFAKEVASFGRRRFNAAVAVFRERPGAANWDAMKRAMLVHQQAQQITRPCHAAYLEALRRFAGIDLPDVDFEVAIVRTMLGCSIPDALKED